MNITCRLPVSRATSACSFTLCAAAGITPHSQCLLAELSPHPPTHLPCPLPNPAGTASPARALLPGLVRVLVGRMLQHTPCSLRLSHAAAHPLLLHSAPSRLSPLLEPPSAPHSGRLVQRRACHCTSGLPLLLPSPSSPPSHLLPSSLATDIPPVRRRARRGGGACSPAPKKLFLGSSTPLLATVFSCVSCRRFWHARALPEPPPPPSAWSWPSPRSPCPTSTPCALPGFPSNAVPSSIIPLLSPLLAPLLALLLHSLAPPWRDCSLPVPATTTTRPSPIHFPRNGPVLCGGPYPACLPSAPPACPLCPRGVGPHPLLSVAPSRYCPCLLPCSPFAPSLYLGVIARSHAGR
jgi:hypothetical protein